MRIFRRLGPLWLALSAAGLGCSTTTKPCSWGGDVSWTPVLIGDHYCVQREVGGRWANDGKYKLLDPDGKVLLEGEFKAGKKVGLWTQYNEKGEKLAEKFFENGIERLLPAQPPEAPLPSRSAQAQTSQSKK